MGVDAHIARSAAEALTLAIGNVLLGSGVTVLLCHAKIDHVNQVGTGGVGSPNKEVVGLDVTIDERALVDGLHPRDHLLRDHHHCLEAELAAAPVEQVFQARSQKINDQD